ncbi:P-loop containing nucleoside triphosphate hydrolase protein [Ilyonectria sp. MPI-CAGE-AT-0026]|nr:P-loop containing nucleoside triphosphate hydrolase protein [Ilyonectria sp. MPI-CAGE-AT-0026]
MTEIKLNGLNGLYTQEQQQLLDAIASLASLGIDHDISVPKIVVCGDRSSGKSSVLEAISGVPFPVGIIPFPRFPTEVVLRKTTTSGAKVYFTRHDSKDEFPHVSLHLSLSEFLKEPECLENLPLVIEKAQTSMGLLIPNKEVSIGPDCPLLTLVDLPSLTPSDDRTQPDSDACSTENCAQRYMSNPDNIILAVVSAKHDFASQASDPMGHRTIGPGSFRENEYISLARNKEIYFKLGWNCNLPQSALGVETLRNRLRNLLIRSITAELPGLIEQIQSESEFCQDMLNKFGQPRNSVDNQRVHLLQVSQSFQALTKAAIDGTYNDRFFENVINPDGDQRRFLAVVQKLNDEFATELIRRGQSYRVVLNFGAFNQGSLHSFITRDQFIAKISRKMEDGGGLDPPEFFDFQSSFKFMKEQMTPWKDITREHVRKLRKAAGIFLEDLIEHADPSMFYVMWETVVEPKLDALFVSLEAKMAGLHRGYQKYDALTIKLLSDETPQKVQFERDMSEMTDKMKGFLHRIHTWHNLASSALNYLDVCFEVSFPEISKRITSDKHKQQVALKHFIDDVAVEVIDKILLSGLGDILTPDTVAMMPDRKVTQIAGETNKSRKARESLQKDLETLDSGLKTCKKHL